MRRGPIEGAFHSRPTPHNAPPPFRATPGQATRIFGARGWVSEIQSLVKEYEEHDAERQQWSIGYSCTVRVALRGGTRHDGIGFGSVENETDHSAAIERSRAAAVSSGFAMALSCFGPALGSGIGERAPAAIRLLPLVEVLPLDTLEICGEPGTGKTALLMEIAIKCIAPVQFDGHGATVIVVDTEGSFCIGRLVRALTYRIFGRDRAADLLNDADTLACLRRLHIIRATTQQETILGLTRLLLLARAGRPSLTETANFLLLDR
jgi:hypothetical protein